MKEINLKDNILTKISKLTKFDIKDIKLISSSKLNENSQDFDCHEFNYKGKKYTLIKDKLTTDKN